MIAQKLVSVTSTAQSINTLFGTTLNFTKIRFGFGVVQYGDSSLNPSTNPGPNTSNNFPNTELEFDPDDDPGNNLFLAASSTTNISIFVW